MTIEERLESLENFRTQSLDIFDQTLAVLQSITVTLEDRPVFHGSDLVDSIVASLQSHSTELTILQTQLS